MFFIYRPFAKWSRTTYKKGEWYHAVLATSAAGLFYGLIMLLAFAIYESQTETKWVNTQELSRHSQTILDLEKGLVKAEYCVNADAAFNKQRYCDNAIKDLKSVVGSRTAKAIDESEGDRHFIVAVYKLELINAKSKKLQLQTNELEKFLSEDVKNLISVSVKYQWVFYVFIAYIIASFFFHWLIVSGIHKPEWMSDETSNESQSDKPTSEQEIQPSPSPQDNDSESTEGSKQADVTAEDVEGKSKQD